MSKDKPEVGDVFYNEHFQNRFIITHKYKMKDNSVACILFNGIRCWVEFETWINADYKYLGKSIVNIDDLFEVVPELTAKDVTKLMDITGCGMLACKHALIKFKGNSELALDYLMGGWND